MIDGDVPHRLMASTNKCLAESNKSRTEREATKKRVIDGGRQLDELLWPKWPISRIGDNATAAVIRSSLRKAMMMAWCHRIQPTENQREAIVSYAVRNRTAFNVGG
jgi:hypothetical protein